MKLKNKWKRFWTLERHANHGFTLVELIVVIAILGILAGAGTAGYAGYVKQANKKADLTTVGNIQRVLEVGVYSNSFQLPDALQLSSEGITYPVGFIVLTEKQEDGTGGVQLLSTGSSYSVGEQDAECVEAKVTLVDTYSEPQHIDNGGILGLLQQFGVNVPGEFDVYNPSTFTYVKNEDGTTEISYCRTHSKLPAPRKFYTGSTPVNKWWGSYTKPTGTEQSAYFEADCVGYNRLAMDHTYGEKRETTEITSGAEGSVGVNNSVLQDALTVAYGDSWNNVGLQYDGWTSSTMSSFYTNASSVVGDLYTMADRVVGYGDAQSLAMSKVYDSSDELVAAVAEKTTSMSQQDWVNQWKLVGASSADSTMFESADFGVAGGVNNGREFYSAARGMYNYCFAAYLTDNGHAEHADEIKNFSSPASAFGLEIDMGLPAVICESAFVHANSKLDDAVKSCSTCLDLYREYVKEGGAAEANAAATYDMFKTVSQNMGEVDKTVQDEDTSSIMSHYQNYLNEFSDLYTNVKNTTAGKSAIVITVYYKDGALSYEVSPQEANPRETD